MPEGPEIRRAADKIEAVLKNNVVEQIEFGLPKLKKYARVFRGERVLGMETRGKALLTHFANDYSIYSHNQLYGVWKVVKRGKLPSTNRQLRLALHTANHSALLYSASDISVWPTLELGEHPFLKKLGPDILNPALSWRDVVAQLTAKKNVGRALSAVYLDQAFLAGLGNYLRSEILFLAGLHPSLKPSELTRGQLGTLARTTLQVSQRSYALNGVTLPEPSYKALRKAGGTYEKSRFYVFGRAGQACRKCGSEIQRIELNTRRVYLCEMCQPARA